MLTARKLNDEFNIFEGMITNGMFISIWIIILAGQIIIMQLGSKAMKIHIAGITGTQWLLTVLVAFSGMIWNAILKLVPDKICPVLGDETEEEVRQSIEDYNILRGIANSNK
jgi:Ca2+-transporting ATPase